MCPVESSWICNMTMYFCLKHLHQPEIGSQSVLTGVVLRSTETKPAHIGPKLRPLQHHKQCISYAQAYRRAGKMSSRFRLDLSSTQPWHMAAMCSDVASS